MRALRFTAFVAAPTFFLALFVTIAALRMGYPYELEWMEGGMLTHVDRVLAGEPLYVAPSLDFVPFIYTPLYFWVAAGAAALLGDGFFPLRLVSFLSTLGCFGLLFRFAWRETDSREAGLLAAGLFAATFQVSGLWLDLARVDSLFLFLLLGGAYAARYARGAAGLVIGGSVLGLAFLTKQSTLLAALPVLIWTVWMHRGLARGAGLAAFAVVAGGGTLWLETLSGGWFTYYVFTLPGHHALLPSVLVSFWSEDLLRPMGWAAFASVVFLASAPRDQRLFYLCLWAGLIGASYVSRLHSGGYVNVLIPAYAALALGFALSVGGMERWALAQGAHVAALLWLGVGLQFAALLYNPNVPLPRPGDWEAGDRALATIAGVSGTVWLPSQGYLAERAGKRPLAHAMGLVDVHRGDPHGEGARLLREVEEAIQAQRFEAVVVDSDGAYRDLVEGAYGRGRPPDRERGILDGHG